MQYTSAPAESASLKLRDPEARRAVPAIPVTGQLAVRVDPTERVGTVVADGLEGLHVAVREQVVVCPAVDPVAVPGADEAA